MPNSANLVLLTFIASPENSMTFSIVSTMVLICWGELWDAMKMLMSSAKTSISFFVPEFEVHGVMF